MPTITLQVGQCGNQLGTEFWKLASKALHGESGHADTALHASDEFFREGRARCLLIDTEPKVVSHALAQDSRGVFQRQRCFVGQSGRGNNWAFGYRQLSPAVVGGGSRPELPGGWDWRTHTDDPSAAEFGILDAVVEGIRHEAEACDAAPNFLLMHSLGGGSGSGLGSRILEHVRQEYPLNYVAAVSVAPRAAGDSPLQSLNTVMALSFLQAYADVVLLYDNQAVLDTVVRSNKGASMSDVNAHIARSALGALWPLEHGEPGTGNNRIRDMVGTVGADCCLKLLDVRTATVAASFGPQGMWRDACKAVAAQYPRSDALDGNGTTPAVTSSVLVTARGMTPQQQPAGAAGGSKAGCGTHTPSHKPGAHAVGVSASHASHDPGAGAGAALAAALQAFGGAQAFACPVDAASSVWVRQGSVKVPGEGAGSSSSKGSDSASLVPRVTLTAVANRSTAIGLLSTTAARARTICTAGAYLHWYERYGCGRQALDEAMNTVDSMADAYRLAHGIRDFL